jgi:hypothetical protein
MCYHSTTLHPSKYRNAKPGEYLTVTGNNGHTFLTGSDGKVVCAELGTRVQIERLEFANKWWENSPAWSYAGKPLNTTICMGVPGYAGDHILVGYTKMHFAHLRKGTKVYVPLELETRLGMVDPSIAYDHKDLSDEQPTLARALGRALGVCSITR